MTVPVVMLMTVVLVTVVMLTVVAVVVTLVVAAQPARIVHNIQHARRNALPHIDKCPVRAHAK